MPTVVSIAESPQEIFERTRAREIRLSRLLIFYICSGLLFMLLPGTFLGVWNLISISGRRAPESISPAWIQAHGHAQVLGWIGSFILAIGYYSIPKLRGGSKPFALWSAWLAGAMWMCGVLLRWLGNVYQWHWRTLLPCSAALELAAFLIFFRAISHHKPQDSGKQHLERWVFVVIAGTLGLLCTLLLNLAACVWLATAAATPALPPDLDQRFLVLAAWGFMVPFVWGFSAKWLPIFLGSRSPDDRLLLAAVAVHMSAVALGLAGLFRVTSALIVVSVLLAVCSLRIFSPPERPAKTKGIHGSFPFFVRSAYVWLAAAAALGLWAASSSNPAGIWGASRHALTVGFISTMVFCIGQRVLPAFSGMRLLFSPRLMFAGLLLLGVGCLLRVTSEVLAYQEIAPAAWAWLPRSAVLELAAITVFAVNLMLTFLRPPVSKPSP
ncbi:MAG TPA: NnrS family protein [Candidatus Binatia bacterium]|nr:NnrS family protein [Candidatus Binatia bacterium]